MVDQKMQHTPGPWSLREWADGCGWMVGTSRSMDWIGDITSNGPSSQEQEANARLIAAAPELLGALEEFCDISGDAWCQCGDTALNERARAATAKARGSV